MYIYNRPFINEVIFNFDTFNLLIICGHMHQQRGIFTFLKYYITLLLSLRWRLYRGQSNNSQLPENEKPLLPPRREGLLKFCAVAEQWNWGKSGKSCETQKNTRNIAQFGGNLTEYMSFQHIWDLFRLMELFLAVHFQIYLETSSLQRENIPKLPGVLRLSWQKTGHWPVHELVVVKKASDDL